MTKEMLMEFISYRRRMISLEFEKCISSDKCDISRLNKLKGQLEQLDSLNIDLIMENQFVDFDNKKMISQRWVKGIRKQYFLTCSSSSLILSMKDIMFYNYYSSDEVFFKVIGGYSIDEIRELFDKLNNEMIVNMLYDNLNVKKYFDKSKRENAYMLDRTLKKNKKVMASTVKSTIMIDGVSYNSREVLFNHFNISVKRMLDSINLIEKVSDVSPSEVSEEFVKRYVYAMSKTRES